MPLAVTIAPGTFLAIVACSALAATIAAFASTRGVALPVVVVELLLGIAIGPQALGLHLSEFISFFSALGLGLLFFFAGYEIDLQRIAGRPLELGGAGWGMSLVIAYALAGVLVATGAVESALYTGSAMATTALGTLIPALSDSGELRTRFGTYLLAAGAVGEFGPILLLTLILSADGTLHNAVILVAFVALAVGVAVFAVRSAERTLPWMARTMEASGQLAVRWIVVLIFALALLAFELGLDLLLGGFAAGVITRQVLKGHELPGFESKLTAVAYGVFVPFFFVVSGMKVDIDALFASASGVLKMLVFFVFFLIVRGMPAVLLYRRVLDERDRVTLALMCATQLPLVVAITTLAVEDHHMRTVTAAALVGAAVLSTLFFPALGLRLRGHGEEETAVAVAEV